MTSATSGGLDLNGGGTPSWTPLTPAGPTPIERFGHGAVFDAQRQRMVVFGGAGPYESSSSRGDAWALSNGETPEWQPLTPLGPLPDPRSRFHMIFQPAAGRVILFSGAHEDNFGGFYAVDPDVWALDFGPAVASIDPKDSPRTLLLAPRPNPFRGVVDIGFALPKPMHVSIDVLDLEGRRVSRLADEDLDAGIQTRRWRGVTDSGAPSASGVYFVRMITPLGTYRRKVVLAR